MGGIDYWKHAKTWKGGGRVREGQKSICLIDREIYALIIDV